jgi:hypothetical protein
MSNCSARRACRIVARRATIPDHEVPMKILYKPFGLILGLLAGFLSQKLFNVVWGVFDKEEPPEPTTQEAAWAKVIAAAAVQGLTFRVTRAAVDRFGAKGFHYFTGIWPGERVQEESQAAEAVR